MRTALLVVIAAALVLGGCAREPGLGARARLPVAETDRIEVREVVAPLSPEERDARDDDVRLPTPFGEYAVPIRSITGSELDRLVEAVADARYIHQGNVVYDLANPALEVVFLQGDDELARLGYYLEAGRWGEHEVPGRWMGEDWRLLALTHELPSHVLE